MVGLPHVVVGDFPANFLRLLPSVAGLISVSFKRSLDFGDALGSGLRLHAFCILRVVGGRWRPGEKGSSDQRNQAVPKDHLAPVLCSAFRRIRGLAAQNPRAPAEQANPLGLWQAPPMIGQNCRLGNLVFVKYDRLFVK